MSERKRLALRLVLWVAKVLFGDDLTSEEKEQIETIRVAINVEEL